MTRTAAIVSARVDHDVAAWVGALRELGHDVASVAPDEPVPTVDLCVVHDPRALTDAAELVARVRAAADRVVVRWRGGPGRELDVAGAPWDAVEHVTPTLHACRDLEGRGLTGIVCLPDAFDLDPVPGDREATRAALGFGPDDIVLLQPTRVTARTNLAGAVRYANELARFIRNRPLRLWVRGPIADDQAALATKLLDACAVPVTVTAVERPADAYAAADVVVYPVSADPFGDAVLEAVAHRRPVACSEFPVLSELVAGGIRVLPIGDPATLVKFLAQSESARRAHLDATARRARVSYSITDFAARVGAVLDRTGGDPS